MQLLGVVQRILRKMPDGEVLVQLVVPVDGDGVLLSGLGALLKSARQENPGVIAQVLAVEPEIGADTLAARVSAEARAPVSDVRYVDGEREVLRLEALPGETAAGPAALTSGFERSLTIDLTASAL